MKATQSYKDRLARLEQRVTVLEEKVRQLEQEAKKPESWWVASAGRFANDPVFDEIIRLGREYRESLRPGRKKQSPRRRAKK